MIDRRSNPTVYRIRRYDEIGDPEPVSLPVAKVKKMEYLRDQWREDDYCEVFRDRKSGECYLVPTGERAERTASASRVGLGAARQGGKRASPTRPARAAERTSGGATGEDAAPSTEKVARRKGPRKERTFYLDPL